MVKVLRLAKREYLATVRTKGFIIGLVLAPILMSGGALAMMLLKNQVDTTDKHVAIVDRSGVIATALVQAAQAYNAKEVRDPKTGKKIHPAYLFEVVAPNFQNPEAQKLELSNLVRAKKLHAFIDIGADIVNPKSRNADAHIAYHAKNAALDEVRRWLADPVNDRLRRLRLEAAGIDESKVKNLFHWASIDSMGLMSVDAKTGEVIKAQHRGEGEAVAMPMIIQILLFMLFMMGVAPMLQTVMEEKSQRIAEVMLGAVTPFQFMMGKLLGSLAVSFTGSAIYVLGAVFTLMGLALTEFVPYGILPWFFAYMLLAIFMYGALFAALGSACNDPKDAQSLQLPAMLPMMIPMFLLGPVLQQPNSPFSVWMSLFPPFAPMLMLLRMSIPGGIPAWQAWVGITGVLIFAVISVWVAGRVFRVGILMQGKPPKLAEICRWAIRG